MLLTVLLSLFVLVANANSTPDDCNGALSAREFAAEQAAQLFDRLGIRSGLLPLSTAEIHLNQYRRTSIDLSDYVASLGLDGGYFERIPMYKKLAPELDPPSKGKKPYPFTRFRISEDASLIGFQFDRRMFDADEIWPRETHVFLGQINTKAKTVEPRHEIILPKRFAALDFRFLADNQSLLIEGETLNENDVREVDLFLYDLSQDVPRLTQKLSQAFNFKITRLFELKSPDRARHYYFAEVISAQQGQEFVLLSVLRAHPQFKLHFRGRLPKTLPAKIMAMSGTHAENGFVRPTAKGFAFTSYTDQVILEPSGIIHKLSKVSSSDPWQQSPQNPWLLIDMTSPRQIKIRDQYFASEKVVDLPQMNDAAITSLGGVLLISSHDRHYLAWEDNSLDLAVQEQLALTDHHVGIWAGLSKSEEQIPNLEIIQIEDGQ